VSPDVTVGLVVDRDPAVLRRSLPAARSQTVGCRIVVADVLGDPRLPTVLAELAPLHGDVELLEARTGRGVAAARNALLEMAGDTMIAWLTAGSVWHPRTLELQAALAADAAGSVLVTAATRVIDPGTRRQRRVPALDATADPRRLLGGSAAFEPSTVLARADDLRRLGGYDERLDGWEELDLLLRAHAHGWQLAGVSHDVPLVTRVLADDDPRPGARAELRLLRKHRGLVGDASRHRQARRRRAEELAALGRPLPAVAHRARVRLAELTDRLRAAPSTPDGGDDAAVTERPVRERPFHTDDRPRPVPDDVAARLAHVEEPAREERWDDAVTGWAVLDRSAREHATEETYTLIARSLRAIGEYERAIEVAEEGMARWPTARSLPKELYKSRAAAIDWGSSLLPPDGEPSHSTAGDVSSLGELAGDHGPVTGWVELAGRDAPQVSLLVNGRPVATTHAVGESRAAGGFAISCQQVREYLGDGDVLRVVSEAGPLTIEGRGVERRVATGHPSRFADLEARLDRGAVFTKFGKLRKGHTPKRRRAVLDRYEALAGLLHEHAGLRCQPFYGNLLGAVREQDLIAHDVGAFDMGYLSDHRKPAAVRGELVDVCAHLLETGHHLRMTPWSVMVRRDPGEEIAMDLNVAWFDEEGHLGLSYGWRHERVRDAEGYRSPRDCPLGDRLVDVPGVAEAVLEQVYGPRWRIPDQGFEPDAVLRRDVRYLLTVADIEAVRAVAPTRVLIDAVLHADGEPEWRV
jgi:hypothetical protein